MGRGALALVFAGLLVGREAAAQGHRRHTPPNAAVVALHRLAPPAPPRTVDYRRMILRQPALPPRPVQMIRWEVLLLRCALAGGRPAVCRGPFP